MDTWKDAVIIPKDTDRKANSIDTDQCALSENLGSLQIDLTNMVSVLGVLFFIFGAYHGSF